MEQSVQIIPFGGLLSGQGPPKITKGGPFDPHWPISIIKPENGIILCGEFPSIFRIVHHVGQNKEKNSHDVIRVYVGSSR